MYPTRSPSPIVRRSLGMPRPALRPSGELADSEVALSGAQIERYQRRLSDLGYRGEGGALLRIDSDVGPSTRSAVRSFQGVRGLAVNGELNAETRAALDAPNAPRAPRAASASDPTVQVAVPNTGTVRQSELGRVPGRVAFFQQVLSALGANDGGRLVVDDALGPVTERAVREFQGWWSPANLRRPNASPNPDDQARWRAALARLDGGRLAVDGDLGPSTQRLLLWLAMPRERGGGGEATNYASFAPTNPAVRPAVLTLLGDGNPPTGYRLAQPAVVGAATDPAAPPPVSRPRTGRAYEALTGQSTLGQEILGAVTAQSVESPQIAMATLGANTVRRVPGRRTIALYGLNPSVGARVYADGVDVTAMGEENGTAARWSNVNGVPVWRMGVPDTTVTLRVVAPDRGPQEVSLPPAPMPLGRPTDAAAPEDNTTLTAQSIVARSVRVDVPLTGQPVVARGEATPNPATPNPALPNPRTANPVSTPQPQVQQAGMLSGNGAMLVGGLVVAGLVVAAVMRNQEK